MLNKSYQNYLKPSNMDMLVHVIKIHSRQSKLHATSTYYNNFYVKIAYHTICQCSIQQLCIGAPPILSKGSTRREGVKI